MKKGTAKRVLALLICAVMAVSMLPTVAMAEEVTEDVIDDSTIEAYTSYENGEDAGVSGVSVTDEKPNTDIKVIPSDANALILMDTGAQSPKGVPGQVVKIVLPAGGEQGISAQREIHAAQHQHLSRCAYRRQRVQLAL